MGRLKLLWWVVNINLYEVNRAFKTLKWNKAAGVDHVQDETLKYGGRGLAIQMSLAFTACLLKISISILLSNAKASSSETETQAHRCEKEAANPKYQKFKMLRLLHAKMSHTEFNVDENRARIQKIKRKRSAEK